ncbi:DNA adenine methylase [Sanguibacter sp. A247]|uniref:DNA adenine methylase n=1 Tax=unclassified Sanguibacter TaxID=2645534 RepID=UPI003FD727EA
MIPSFSTSDELDLSPGLPVLKWVGGKRRLLPRITPHFAGRSNVVEPFLGGGALAFHLSGTHPGLRVLGNDFLAPVVEIYEAVRTDVQAFIAEVDSYAVPYLALEGKAARRAFYCEVREKYVGQAIDGPAPLFFMLWCAYSGLYRTGKNSGGRFNTSHGFGTEKPGFYHPERVRRAGELMRAWELMSGDLGLLHE